MRPSKRAPWPYRVLTRLYPASFREEFGREMEHELSASLTAAGGTRERVRVWRHAVWDLVVSVPREHWEWIRDGRNWEMRGLAEDARRAARGLLRNPSFTTVAILTLALGIGTTTVIFSVVNAVLLQPLPYPDAERIVSIGEEVDGTPGQVLVSYPNAQDWKASQSTLDAIALLRFGALTLETSEGAQQLSAFFTDGELFGIFGARAARGRLFGVDDNRVPGGHPIVVLSHDAWQRLFGGDPGVVGRALRLSGTPFTVVGVLAAEFRDPFYGVDGDTNDLFVPAMMIGQIDPQGNDLLSVRRLRTFSALGKLRVGATVADADGDLRRIAAALEREYPINKGMSASVVPFAQTAALGIRGPALTLLGGAIVLLVIACFGVANLNLVRGASRTQELALQIALGAGRSRVFALLGLESLLLALTGGALGIAVAYLALPPLMRLVPNQLPPTADVRINLPVLLVALAASLVAGLGSGLLPALRVSASAVEGAVPRAGRMVGDRGGDRVRRGLVLAEIATATILLASSAVLVRSFREISRADSGFATENILTMRLNLPASNYADDRSMAAAAEQLRDRVAALPGVAWAQPWGPGRPGLVFSLQTSVPDDMLIDEISEAPLARRHSVGPAALEDMGLILLRGRTIAETDDADAPFVAVISESMARDLWPGEDPIGKRYHNFQPPGAPIPSDRHWTVIGVVADASHGGRVPLPGSLATRYDSYFPFAQRPERAFTMLVKKAGAYDVDPIREVVREFDRGIPVFQVATMAENFAQEERTSRFAAQLMAAFGAAALLLAALGVYGVLSFTVVRREREIGLRAALGAPPGRTLRHFLRYGFELAVAGVLLGAATAFAATRGLQAVVPSVPDMDGRALAVAGGALLVVAIASCLLPALRATRIAPVVALEGD